MKNIKIILVDLKILSRDPIMILLFAMPLLYFFIVKVILNVATPLIYDNWNIDILNYKSYILALSFIMIPGMLGTVTAFLMIDDRDAKIYELLSVTPIGYKGYLFNRMLLPFIFSILYALLGNFFLDIIHLNTLILLSLLLFLPIESISIGMLLFILSEDKVKGLTYAKGLGLLYITSLAQLVKHPIIIGTSSLLPFYWIWMIIDQPSILNISTGFLVHLFWLLITYILMNKKIR
ncbi:hypothetical protein GC105_08265 [Alkalibaculum sp. M08DMB]|uniref:Uncharacterized protein n=1 Tax=Alkalibaculum sporogenes TaxID=2655001 RepID=A0A6A7K8Q7_9FIRM|nr:hypothetical protein [Alkalibaculum sporogenes]MPW25782.1 hypothetical protein [Alkalibaculum sporogenes]